MKFSAPGSDERLTGRYRMLAQHADRTGITAVDVKGKR